jgi:hypothetical protein
VDGAISVQEYVVLRRPTPAAPGTRNPFVGNWINKRGPTDCCLHIAEESDGQLNGWVDSVPAPERIIFPRGMPRTPMMGHYGDMTKVGPAKDGQITVSSGPTRGCAVLTPSKPSFLPTALCWKAST